MRVGYPIALDNDFAVWRAFGNRYWPAVYIADAEGRIRHHHFGEGGYDECERAIQQLLREAGAEGIGDDLVSVADDGFEAQADWATLQSPETYLSYEQAQSFASPGGAKLDEPRAYSAPDSLRLNEWALAGDWTVARRASVLNGGGGRIVFRFHARDVNLVMGPPTQGTRRAVPRARRRRASRRRARARRRRAGQRDGRRAAALPAGSRAGTDRRPHLRDRLPRAPASRPTCSPSADAHEAGPRKRFTEPVALSSTASIDFSPSGLAAFRVQPLETTSTYSRSVLGACGNLAIAAVREQARRARTAATSAKSVATARSPRRSRCA